MNLERIFLKSKKFVSKNKGLLTTIGACAGVGVTIFLTARATLKIENVLNEAKENELKGLKKTVIKHSAPPAISAALTIFCIILTYRFGKAAEAGLLALVAGGAETLKRYREGVVNSGALSPDEEVDLYEDAVEDVESKPLPEKENYNEYKLFKEALTGEYFYATEKDILIAEIKLNRNIGLGEYESFWFWLQCLTDTDTFNDYKKAAVNCGWCSKGWGSEEKYGYGYVDICKKQKVDSNGREYTLIYYPFLPHTDYDDVDLADDREFTVSKIMKTYS